MPIKYQPLGGLSLYETDFQRRLKKKHVEDDVKRLLVAQASIDNKKPMMFPNRASTRKKLEAEEMRQIRIQEENMRILDRMLGVYQKHSIYAERGLIKPKRDNQKDDSSRNLKLRNTIIDNELLAKRLANASSTFNADKMAKDFRRHLAHREQVLIDRGRKARRVKSKETSESETVQEDDEEEEEEEEEEEGVVKTMYRIEITVAEAEVKKQGDIDLIDTPIGFEIEGNNEIVTINGLQCHSISLKLKDVTRIERCAVISEDTVVESISFEFNGIKQIFVSSTDEEGVVSYVEQIEKKDDAGQAAKKGKKQQTSTTANIYLKAFEKKKRKTKSQPSTHRSTNATSPVKEEPVAKDEEEEEIPKEDTSPACAEAEEPSPAVTATEEDEQVEKSSEDTAPPPPQQGKPVNAATRRLPYSNETCKPLQVYLLNSNKQHANSSLHHQIEDCDLVGDVRILRNMVQSGAIDWANMETLSTQRCHMQRMEIVKRYRHLHKDDPIKALEQCDPELAPVLSRMFTEYLRHFDFDSLHAFIDLLFERPNKNTLVEVKMQCKKRTKRQLRDHLIHLDEHFGDILNELFENSFGNKANQADQVAARLNAGGNLMPDSKLVRSLLLTASPRFLSQVIESYNSQFEADFIAEISGNAAYAYYMQLIQHGADNIGINQLSWLLDSKSDEGMAAFLLRHAETDLLLLKSAYEESSDASLTACFDDWPNQQAGKIFKLLCGGRLDDENEFEDEDVMEKDGTGDEQGEEEEPPQPPSKQVEEKKSPPTTVTTKREKTPEPVAEAATTVESVTTPKDTPPPAEDEEEAL